VAGGPAVSAAHAGDLTLAVAGPPPLGCDLELVVARPASLWQELLGPERIALAEVIAKEADEDTDTATTRVWAAAECLKKAGVPATAPLTFLASLEDGWVSLSCSSLILATVVVLVRGLEGSLVLAVVMGNDDPSVPSTFPKTQSIPVKA